MDIDQLPEAIIHHILALIPGGVCTKQLIRLSLISKGWLQACCSYRVIDICHTCNYTSRESVSESEGFIRWVDKTITRFCDDSRTTMLKLKLHLGFQLQPSKYNISDCLDDQVTNALDKWINLALDNHVEELDLRVKVSGGRVNSSSSSGYYIIPTRVMSSSVLKSLFLGHQVCLPSNMDSVCRRLGSLEIFQVPDINSDGVFQRLIEACPCLETLTIKSNYLNDINISSLNHIKMITIKRNKPPPSFFKLKIDAPSLETLILSYLVDSNKTIDCCNLKYMKLTSDASSYEDDKFFSRFPMLETLELTDCVLERLKLYSNLMLKKVEVNVCNVYKVYSPTRNHIHFLWEIDSPRSLETIWLGNVGPRYFEMVLKGSYRMHIFPNRFRKLRDNLLSTNHRSVSCKFTWERESNEEKEMVPTHLPACEIDNLTLAVDAPSRSCPVILSRFFSTLHPTTLQASLIDDTSNGSKGRDFLKSAHPSIVHHPYHRQQTIQHPWLLVFKEGPPIIEYMLRASFSGRQRIIGMRRGREASEGLQRFWEAHAPCRRWRNLTHQIFDHFDCGSEREHEHLQRSHCSVVEI